MALEADSQFLDEVLGLFALEAQEWVGQAKVALKELADPSKPCSPERTAKLYDTIVRGISNLGGSAATVNLEPVEKVAFALLPVLQAMQTHDGIPSSDHTTAVEEALDQILIAVQRVAQKQPGPIDVESMVSRLERSRMMTAQAVTTDGRGVRSEELRHALFQIRDVQSRSSDGTRNLAEVVLHKAEGDGEHDMDDRTVAKILRELELLDQQFLDEVRRRAPVINEGYTRFRTVRSAGTDVPGTLEERTRGRIFQEIEHLYEISRLVNSTPIMFYLQGLRTFLTVASERPILISEQRYQAVGRRVALLQALAERWVEVGRHERASIEKCLQTKTP